MAAMSSKPLTMRHGFALGGAVILLGIVLQFALGPLHWQLIAFPVNIIMLVLLLLAVALMYILRRKVRFFGWMMHYGAAVPSLIYALGLTLLMGFIAQGADGPPVLGQMLSFWPFVLSWCWMLLIASLATVERIVHFKAGNIPFILNHLGVVVAVVAATFGSADRQDLRIISYRNIPEWRAVRGDGAMQELDIAIELHKFIMETYPDGSPSRFASEITVHRQRGGSTSGTVEVNHPMKVAGWKIYQYGYDTRLGAESRYSTFQVVRDPWLPAVYAGIFMMLAGALCLMLFSAPGPAAEDKEHDR